MGPKGNRRPSKIPQRPSSLQPLHVHASPPTTPGDFPAPENPFRQPPPLRAPLQSDSPRARTTASSDDSEGSLSPPLEFIDESEEEGSQESFGRSESDVESDFDAQESESDAPEAGRTERKGEGEPGKVSVEFIPQGLGRPRPKSGRRAGALLPALPNPLSTSTTAKPTATRVLTNHPQTGTRLADRPAPSVVDRGLGSSLGRELDPNVSLARTADGPSLVLADRIVRMAVASTSGADPDFIHGAVNLSAADYFQSFFTGTDRSLFVFTLLWTLGIASAFLILCLAGSHCSWHVLHSNDHETRVSNDVKYCDACAPPTRRIYSRTR